ncbi:MAG: nucleotidyltransferase family protein [Hyphomicrobiaceae bacterium]
MTATPQTAFVLAAGLGQRMRPLTDTIPKPMVTLGGRPLIDHVLDRLAAAGVTRAVVNVHYKAEPLIAHLKTREIPHIELSDERAELLDTGGGAAKALPLLRTGPFFIHNSDTVWIEYRVANLERLAAAWDPSRMDALLLLARRDTALGYDGKGDFHLLEDGRLRRRSDDVAGYVFAGVSIADRQLFRSAPDGAFSLNLVWNHALAAGRLFGLPLDGEWMHIGTPQALDDAEKHLLTAGLR